MMITILSGIPEAARDDHTKSYLKALIKANDDDDDREVGMYNFRDVRLCCQAPVSSTFTVDISAPIFKHDRDVFLDVVTGQLSGTFPDGVLFICGGGDDYYCSKAVFIDGEAIIRSQVRGDTDERQGVFALQAKCNCHGDVFKVHRFDLWNTDLKPVIQRAQVAQKPVRFPCPASCTSCSDMAEGDTVSEVRPLTLLVLLSLVP